MSAVATLSSAPPREPPRARLEYLDGVRALAAVYVSLYHAVLTGTWVNPYVPSWENLSVGFVRFANVLLFGHFGVSVFIILSGYCLMLPVARRNDGCLPGGTLAFLGRRARRLLPPYYAAMMLALLLAQVPGLDRLTGARWDESLPALDRGAIWSHALLVQNWKQDWFLKIDPPAWSVATEWQIYWLFALVLLPLARRVGVRATAAVALAAGVGVHFYFRGSHDFIYYSFVGLFALGMLGAVINFSDDPWAARARVRWPWGRCAALGWGVFAALALWPGRAWVLGNAWLTEPLAGVAMMCLLVYCTGTLAAGRAGTPPLIVRVFQARGLVALGGFSYSYYLVHDPVLSVLHFALEPFGLSLLQTAYATLALCLPFSVAVAYAFHLVFERPFMPGHPQTIRQAAHAAVLSPAP